MYLRKALQIRLTARPYELDVDFEGYDIIQQQKEKVAVIKLKNIRWNKRVLIAKYTLPLNESLLTIGWLGWLTKPTTLHFISSLSLNLDTNTQKLRLPKQWQVISGKAQKAPLDLQDFTGMIISKCDVSLKNEKDKETYQKWQNQNS